MGAVRAGLATVLVLTGARVGVAPAERCPDVDVAQVRAAAEAAVGWLVEHQEPDGRFAYAVDAAGRDLGGYSAVRHAGVLLSLEQAAAADVPGARLAAERARRWALGQLVRSVDGRAVAETDGSVRAGATALLAIALVEAGDVADGALLRDLGRFLAGQVDRDGAVLARWDPSTEAPVPGVFDRFFTGEVLWALHRIDGEVDDPAISAAASAVGGYVPVRDDAEGRFPPVSDHWAAYAYAELGLDRLSSAQRDHADRLAGIIGVQVRVESTRWDGGLQRTLRGGPAVGSGVGTLGEGASALLRLFGEDGAPGLSSRVRCTAGMLVERQATDGAWYTRGATRMDDQQHALSALLAAPAVFADEREPVGGGEEPRGLAWLLLAAVAVGGVLRPGPRAVGSVLGWAAVAAATVAVAGPVLDALDVSPASARMAAGTGVVVAGIGVLAAPSSSVTTGLVAAGAGLLALSTGVDDGLVAVVAVVVAALVGLAVPAAWRRPLVARLAAGAAVLLGFDLLVDGVLGV